MSWHSPGASLLVRPKQLSQLTQEHAVVRTEKHSHESQDGDGRGQVNPSQASLSLFWYLCS